MAFLFVESLESAVAGTYLVFDESNLVVGVRHFYLDFLDRSSSCLKCVSRFNFSCIYFKN